ncbi:hypothetical protein M405DRAFT_291300 [Rhizopogon salebrosus TDB-379]|nr:hypothetical protein M405DRAFT_291300 [Rhizopogon salebrosus TDB-379]
MQQPRCHECPSQMFSTPMGRRNFDPIGEVTNRWLPLTSTTKGSAFLASISHLVFLSPTRFPPGVMCNVDFCSTGRKFSGYYPRKWMASVPWASLKNTQTVSLPFSHVLVPEERPFIDSTDMHIELLTLSAPLGPFTAIGHIKRYADIEDGEGHVSLVDVRATFFVNHFSMRTV